MQEAVHERQAVLTLDMMPRSEKSLQELAGQAANEQAARRMFVDFRSRKAGNTLRRHDADLTLFAGFLETKGVQVGDLARSPTAWTGITWGLVDEFQRWQLLQGFAISSVNARLSTVRQYAKLALKAGAIDPPEFALIRSVEGYSHKEAKRVNDKRKKAGLDIRKGSKKAEPILLSADQVAAIKEQPDTPKGRRDKVLVCLALEHGLRVSELALLQRADFNLAAGSVRFDRPKTARRETHKLTQDTLQAVSAYFGSDAPDTGSIWRTSRRGRPGLSEQGMSDRALSKRIRTLGQGIAIDNLSPHDLRHTWATIAAKNTPLDKLIYAGGWTSVAMAMRYIEKAKIADEG